MSTACVELGQYLNLSGQWGADFVLDELGRPHIVDLNMGRPNGSLSYYCWRGRQPEPKITPGTAPKTAPKITPKATPKAAPKTAPRTAPFGVPATKPRTLALAASTYHIAAGQRLAGLAASLRSEGLLWDSSRGDGTVLAQYLPGVAGGGSVLAASWEGTEAAQRILEAFHAHLAAQQTASDQS